VNVSLETWHDVAPQYFWSLPGMEGHSSKWEIFMLTKSFVAADRAWAPKGFRWEGYQDLPEKDVFTLP
jgi:hypothetical protein